MATGDLIKLGTLYMANVLMSVPTKPISGPGGNVQAYQYGSKLEIRDSYPSDSFKISWRAVTLGGKELLIADRNLLHSITINDLNAQGLVVGKQVTIDGEKYKLRLISGGYSPRVAGNYQSGGSPASNEWDQIIGNESNQPGLITPLSTELVYNSSNVNGPHNKYWNWFDFNSLAMEGTMRGGSTPRGLSPSSGSGTNIGWRPVLEIMNYEPTLTLEVANNKTLYENDTFIIDGTTKDADADDVVTIKYQIDSGTVRNLHSAVSDGTTAINFSKSLTYKDGVLYDGATAITSILDKDTPHTVSIWAEDGKGGKSSIITRTFFVVPNRPPMLTINPITAQSELINSNVINVSGNVVDPDNNDVTVTFAINGGEEQTIIDNGPATSFAFNILLNDLRVGANTVVIKAVDSYQSQIAKTLTINKTHDATPVNEAVALYKISAPTGSAKSILLWITRTLGPLQITPEISFVNDGEAENFAPLQLTNTGTVNGLKQDEYAYQGAEDKTNIVLKITYNRIDPASLDAIKQISGVLF